MGDGTLPLVENVLNRRDKVGFRHFKDEEKVKYVKSAPKTKYMYEFRTSEYLAGISSCLFYCDQEGSWKIIPDLAIRTL